MRPRLSLPIACVVQAELPSDAPGAQSPVFFTDKMVSWDASAPVNQDLSVSIEGQPLKHTTDHAHTHKPPLQINH